SHSKRWHTHHIAGLKFVLRLDPPLIDPHLTLTQDAVDQCLGHTLELGAKKVIDALAGKLRRDLKHLHASGLGRGIGHWRMVSIFMQLKHLNITVIVRHAAKTARSEDASKPAIPDRNMFEDVRPSDAPSLQ